MIELLVLGALGFAALVVLGVLASVASILWFVVALPFTLLRWTFKLLALLFALPFLIVVGALGGLVIGGGALLLFLLPALPFLLIAGLIWGLMKRRHPVGATS